MFRVVSLALFTLALGASPALAVSRGTVTDDSAAPYMAYLGNCTGTLIAPDRVLTAAHCANVIEPGVSSAVIGTNDVGGNKGVRQRRPDAGHPARRRRVPRQGARGEPGLPAGARQGPRPG